MIQVNLTNLIALAQVILSTFDFPYSQQKSEMIKGSSFENKISSEMP